MADRVSNPSSLSATSAAANSPPGAPRWTCPSPRRTSMQMPASYKHQVPGRPHTRHAEAGRRTCGHDRDDLCDPRPAPIIPAARLRRSAKPPAAGEFFQEIGGVGNAFGGFGHPGGDFAGSGDVLRGEDPAQVRDQRFLGGGRKAPGGAHLQSFDLSSPDRLIGPVQRINVGTPARRPAAVVPAPPWWTTARQAGKIAA